MKSRNLRTRSERRKYRRKLAREARLARACGFKAEPQVLLPPKGVIRGGSMNSLNTVQFAQYAFRHRSAEWRTFKVPRWYAKEFGVAQPLLRKRVDQLKSDERELCLLARLSWLVSGHKVTTKGSLLSQVFLKPGKSPFSNEKVRRHALRVVSRKLLQSNLVMRPLIPVTHYLPHFFAASRPAMGRRPLTGAVT